MCAAAGDSAQPPNATPNPTQEPLTGFLFVDASELARCSVPCLFVESMKVTNSCLNVADALIFNPPMASKRRYRFFRWRRQASSGAVVHASVARLQTSGSIRASVIRVVSDRIEGNLEKH